MFLLVNEATTVLLDDIKQSCRVAGRLVIGEVHLDPEEVCHGYRGMKKATGFCVCPTCNGAGALSGRDIVTCLACDGSGCEQCEQRGMQIRHGKECVGCQGSGVVVLDKLISIETCPGVLEGHTVQTMQDGTNIVVKYADGFTLHGMDLVVRIDITLREYLCGFNKIIKTGRGSAKVAWDDPCVPLNDVFLCLKGHGVLTQGQCLVVATLRVTKSDTDLVAKFQPVFRKMFA